MLLACRPYGVKFMHCCDKVLLFRPDDFKLFYVDLKAFCNFLTKSSDCFLYNKEEVFLYHYVSNSYIQYCAFSSSVGRFACEDSSVSCKSVGRLFMSYIWSFDKQLVRIRHIFNGGEVIGVEINGTIIEDSRVIFG